MNNSKIIIPFGELVNRSLSYVMYNFAVLFKMMIVPVLLMFAVQLLLPKLGISLFVMMIIFQMVLMNTRDSIKKVNLYSLDMNLRQVNQPIEEKRLAKVVECMPSLVCMEWLHY